MSRRPRLAERLVHAAHEVAPGQLMCAHVDVDAGGAGTEACVPVGDLAAALQEPGRYAEPLRAAAVARYDWRAIAGRLAETLAALASSPA